MLHSIIPPVFDEVKVKNPLIKADQGVQNHVVLNSTTIDAIVSITDLTIHDSTESDEDNISDVSMDEGILSLNKEFKSLSHSAEEKYVLGCDCSSTTTTNPRVIFREMIHHPNNYSSNSYHSQNLWRNPSSVLQHPSCSSQPDIINCPCSDDYEPRWNTYQEIQHLDDHLNKKVPLSSYEQAIQFYELGLTTIPRSVALKDSSESMRFTRPPPPPPLLFMGKGLHTHTHSNSRENICSKLRKRSISESSSMTHSHTTSRRCIFPLQNKVEDLLHNNNNNSHCPKSIQSYQYSSQLCTYPIVVKPSSLSIKTMASSTATTSSSSLLLYPQRKLKSCIKHCKSHSEGEISFSLTKSSSGRHNIITPSTSNEKDLSVSFDPHVSIYDLGNHRGNNIKYTHPGWSQLFT